MSEKTRKELEDLAQQLTNTHAETLQEHIDIAPQVDDSIIKGHLAKMKMDLNSIKIRLSELESQTEMSDKSSAKILKQDETIKKLESFTEDSNSEMKELQDSNKGSLKSLKSNIKVIEVKLNEISNELLFNAETHAKIGEVLALNNKVSVLEVKAEESSTEEVKIKNTLVQIAQKLDNGDISGFETLVISLLT